MMSGDVEARQERFKVLWVKWRDNTATPDEKQEMLRMQEEYWANGEEEPDATLYRP